MLVPTDFVVAQLALRVTATKATMHAVRRRNHIGATSRSLRWADARHFYAARSLSRKTMQNNGLGRQPPRTRGLRDGSKYVAPHALARPTSETEYQPRPAQVPRADLPGAYL